MRGRILFALTTALLGSAALAPAASAATPALPSCAQLATDPANQLAGNAYVVSATASIVPASGSNKAYCKIQMTFSAHSGPAFGYAVGESEAIQLAIGLPLSSTDGGTGGLQGAWNGGVENLGGGGLVGAVGATTSATNAGYVGSSTDGGHTNAENGTNGNFGVIQATHQLDTGKINDYILESQHQQYVWSLALAKHYYGRAASRNYWNGCSTGGRQGLALAAKWGGDFDGILAGAPATFHEEFRLENVWMAAVNRDLVVDAGHPSITQAQMNAASAGAIAGCDVMGNDKVADGVIDDPRACSWSAANNICGAPNAPAAPNCLDAVQASAIDKMWDGPRNHDGQRIWYNAVRGTMGGIWSTAWPAGADQVVAWDHRDLSTNSTNIYTTRALAAANIHGVPYPTAIEDEYVLSDSAGGAENLMSGPNPLDVINKVHNGPKGAYAKIITWQGGADFGIPATNSVHFYRVAATSYGNGTTDFGTPQSTPGGSGLQSWWRYYKAPGVGHCGGGVGASPLTNLPNNNSQIFDDLVKWVETGVPPQSGTDSTKLGVLAKGPGAYGTRPLCPWPTTAVYQSGPTDVASSYTCEGNLDAAVTGVSPGAPAGTITVSQGVPVVCNMLHTVYGQESSNSLNSKEQGINPALCPAKP